jgi:hypothetical protein
MAGAETERERDQAWHRRQADEHRRQAEQLGRAGFRDQAARHILEARLHDLRVAASLSTSRAA